MASEPEPQVNDEDVAKTPLDMPSSVLSQNVEGYAKYLRQIVAHIDSVWMEQLRPQLNALIHAMEKEVEVP